MLSNYATRCVVTAPVTDDIVVKTKIFADNLRELGISYVIDVL